MNQAAARDAVTMTPREKPKADDDKPSKRPCMDRDEKERGNDRPRGEDKWKKLWLPLERVRHL